MSEQNNPSGKSSQSRPRWIWYRILLALIPVAVSLGGVETTVCQPVATSHQKMDAAERERLGIRTGLIRLSAGIEDAGDLVDDLEHALGQAG